MEGKIFGQYFCFDNAGWLPATKPFKLDFEITDVTINIQNLLEVRRGNNFYPMLLGWSLFCIYFHQNMSQPCDLVLQPRNNSLFKWGEGTISAKGILQVRLCSLQLPSMTRMPCLFPVFYTWAKYLLNINRYDKNGNHELDNLKNC